MLKSIALVLLCLLMIGAVAIPVSAKGRHDGGGGDSEVLSGSFSCGASAESTYSWLVLDATGDIFPSGSRYAYQYPTATGTPAERCEAAANTLRAVLGAECKLGALRASAYEDGENRDFEFVCHGPRARMIETIAEVASAHLESSP